MCFLKGFIKVVVATNLSQWDIQGKKIDVKYLFECSLWVKKKEENLVDLREFLILPKN